MFNSAWIFFFLLYALNVGAADFRWDIEWYNTVKSTEKPQNADSGWSGRILKIPDESFETDLRLNGQWKWESGSKLILRPRFLGSLNQFHFTDPEENTYDQKMKGSLTDAYFENVLSEQWSFTLGLQNYQWGPAEFYSPSNPFYHTHPNQRSYNYRETGKNLIRLNWSPDSSWSVVAMVESVDNGDPYWTYQQSFKPKGIVKLEKRGENSINYIGASAGTSEEGLPFLGQYASYEIFSGISLYVDSRQTQGSAQYEPELNDLGLVDMIYVKEVEKWQTLAIAGLRWEGAVDFRFEYIYNTYGFDQDDMKFALASTLAAHPQAAENLKKLRRSGREMLGLQYLYTSMRIGDFLNPDSNFFLRYLYSLEDQSGIAQVAFDIALGESFNVYAELGTNVGDETGELSSLEASSILLGIKWTL